MLQESLSSILNTTSFHIKRLKEMSIETLRELFLYFPRTYTDAREIKKIFELKINEINTAYVQIRSIFAKRLKTGKYFIKAIATDELGGTLEIIWFNQPHLKRILYKNIWIILSGKVKYEKGKFVMISPRYELLKKEQIHVARIVPVYPETELYAPKRVKGKISSKWIREKLYPFLPYAEYFEEFLPEEILISERLIKYCDAIRNIHFPENEEILKKARERLAFNELFLLQLAALKRKLEWQQSAKDYNKKIHIDWEFTKNFIEKLPFKLTKAQKITLKEILDDLEKPYPMSRLLEGDVGSGKTIVAAIASLNVIKAGFQVCLMAPTEILAKQHYETFMKFLQPENVNIQLITGSTPEKNKKGVIQQMITGTVDIIIGTHSLIQEKINFRNLGLAVIDEQHRFGVKQREKLKHYGNPHILSLSATPIPRTLTLIIYGDQDLSILDEMPPGRKEIITRIVPEQKRMSAYLWVEDQVRKGRQIYIICPLIDPSLNLEMIEIKAAKQEFNRLSTSVFPNLKLALLHGKLKTKEKDEIMENFTRGEINILVSTSVVEVGIDVANATIIIIEGAERFGLAQLHQFRGRVGRGSHQSYCFLFPTAESPEIRKRLEAVVKYSSGFRLAEIDLQMRGPGEVYGIRQSGMPDLKMADLNDIEMIKRTKVTAQTILDKDSELKNYPKLMEKLNEIENIAVDY